MRLKFFAIITVTSVVFLTANIAIAEKLPSRKAGLWEITMTTENMPQPQKSKQCVDEKSDENMIKSSSSMAASMGGSCNEPMITNETGKYTINSECTFSGSKMNSVSTFIGDFSSQYEATTNTTYDPAFMGHTKSEIKFTARWLGECEAGMVPGDIIMSNGMKMNMNSMGTTSKTKIPDLSKLKK